MDQAYADKLEEIFRLHANIDNVQPMEAYMRNQFPFLGIRNPERVALMKRFYKDNGIPAGQEAVETAKAWWRLPEREFHYAAMDMLLKSRKDMPPKHVELLEEWVLTHPWWDTVDFIAPNLIGFHLQQYPKLTTNYVDKWLSSEQMWLQRTAILFQLKYKQNTDTELLFAVVRRMSGSREFFIRKAIGWALREYSKTDAAAVQAFVKSTELSPLSQKEALKVIQRNG
ncbi:DNA alkylation repair protein [Paenibacillus hexagrammi]|uniref:DNA alkylation repair protein n=1 Tax=Paenibacillus hexagrammi TaxID=2908839 RepID=A0ABY3SFH4_9BACL|nr:DNA alkylation repair protein [Paenibacillus sp. YPD9-1]UJF32737.1 DNA alkylation repair protein [Paenibacillus sp. YPD9-1]